MGSAICVKKKPSQAQLPRQQVAADPQMENLPLRAALHVDRSGFWKGSAWGKFKRRALARTKCQRRHRSLWGTPHTRSSVWLLPDNTSAFRKLCFPFSYASSPPSLPFSPSPHPGPNSLIPGAWPRWCVPGGAAEELQRGGSNGVLGDSAPNPLLRGRVFERVMGRDADSVSD